MKRDIYELFEIVESRVEIESYKKNYSMEEKAMLKTIFAFADLIATVLPEDFEEVFKGCLEKEQAHMN